MATLTIPLAAAADQMLRQLAQGTGSSAIAALDGATLLGERAMLFRWRIPGRMAAGGGCQLYAARDDLVALNLARQADRELLPALLQLEIANWHDAALITAAIARSEAQTLLERGRLLGLAIAAEHERAPARGSDCRRLITGGSAPAPRRAAPRVVDLSALWAGPLAAHLLWLAGAAGVQDQSRPRPQQCIASDPTVFARLRN